MILKSLFIATIMLLFLLASACSPKLDQIQPANESFPTDMVSESVDELHKEATPTETETPPAELLLHSPATRTGLESLDKVLEGILSNRVEDRKALVYYTQLACTTADGLGGPPKCQTGEAEGTLLEVLPILGPEGHHARRDAIDQTLSFQVEGLYAIYIIPEDAWQDESYPAGEYGVVVVLSDNPFPMTVHVKEGGMIRLDYHLGKTPHEVLQETRGELVLPPLTNE